MSLRCKQRGISLSGLIYASVILGIVALVGMKLFPLYNEKMKVDFAMDKISSTPDAGRLSKADIVKAIMRQFEVSDVDRWSTQEFSRIIDVKPLKNGKGKHVQLDYEIRGPFFADLDIILKYSKSLDLLRDSTD